MSEKYFITGGAGFIGSHTVDRLLLEGKEVTVFDLKSESEAENLKHCLSDISYIEGDIRDEAAVSEAMAGHTHVLHLAALVSVPVSITDPVGTHATNVTGMLHVLNAARNHDVSRLVYASSAAVYGETTQAAVSEDRAVQPLSPYGLHKCVNEEYAALYRELFDLSTVGLRYFNVFGLRQDPSSPYSGVISIFADRTLRNETVTIFGDGTATRDFVHIDNVVDANIRALNGRDAGVFNVGTGIAHSVADLYQQVCELTETDLEPTFAPARIGDIKHSLADITRIKNALAYAPERDFVSGLKTLFEK